MMKDAMMTKTTIETKPSDWIRARLDNLNPSWQGANAYPGAWMEVCSLSSEWHKIRMGIVIA